MKVTVMLLTGKALTWWRAVSVEPWAQLGVCDWGQWVAHIEAKFRDTHHQFRNQTKLLELRQKTSVQKYNEEFRTLMMEVRHVMSS